MVLPVTGPFTRSVTIKGPPIHTGFVPTIVQANWSYYRQKPPYDRPLIFSLDKYVVTANNFWGTYDSYTPYDSAGTYDSSRAGLAVNKCYGKLVDAMGDHSQWANNLLETRKSLDMVTDRLTQLLRFSKALRRGRFLEASRILGLSRRPHAVKAWKDYGKNWLEYHFGWEPLVQDIHNGLSTLSRDFDPIRISVRGASSDASVSILHNGAQRSMTSRKWETRVRMDCWVKISNPNLNLVSEWGLVNPASVVWEAVPFSFVVDWFLNVGQVLASQTDMFGKSVTQSFTTVYQTIDWNYASSGVVLGPVNPPISGPWAGNQGARSVFVRRTTGITGPVLKVKPFKGFSTVRGVTACALLTQFLRDH